MSKDPAIENESKRQFDGRVAGLLVQVGDRVRKARERKGIPRRVLSEISGVSPRYIAQLESGEGNISIGLLQRVAIALDHRIEWIVGEEDPWNSDLLQIAELYRSADERTREAVTRILNPEPLETRRGNRICLIGLRGAGKSTLGRLLSDAIEVQFLELNKEIENLGGMPIDEIMALYGSEGYRKLEADALGRISESHEDLILAAAGGVVAEPATFNALLTKFNTIWIKASPEEHMERVRAQGDTRPMEGNPEAMAQLKSILKSREVLYERAQACLVTSGVSPEESLTQLIALIEDNGFLSRA